MKAKVYRFDREVPAAGDIFHHFKGDDYKIIAVGYLHNANNSLNKRGNKSTPERQVIYVRIADEHLSFPTFCYRDLDEFLAPVDKDKYPYAPQLWRFEKVGN